MIHLWCLHGNLQLPAVWDPLRTELQTCFGAEIQITAENLLHTLAESCQAWGEQFCQRVDRSTPQGKRVLLGYSLGGRLALHAMVHAPHLWAGAVIIAADPHRGDKRAIAPQTTQTTQTNRSAQWGQRFLHEPWDTLLAEWDALPVFHHRANLTARPEAAFSRTALCHAFHAYDKSKQVDLWAALKTRQHPPILYITGEEDTKYREIGQQLAHTCQSIQHGVIANAAHRVPWENPAAFSQQTIRFLTLLLDD